ncbi:hypothetical protein Ciccas_009657, partial [Cichlidogyrus casuarinus]
RYPLLRQQFALQLEAEAFTNSYEKSTQEEQLKVLEELKIKCIKIMKTIMAFRRVATLHEQGRSEEQVERTKRKLTHLLSDVSQPGSYDPNSIERSRLLQSIASLSVDHSDRLNKIEVSKLRPRRISMLLLMVIGIWDEKSRVTKVQDALRERRKRVLNDIPELQQTELAKTNGLFANLGSASVLATAAVDESRRSESFAAAKVVNRIVAASNQGNQDPSMIPMMDESTDSSEATIFGSNPAGEINSTPLMIVPPLNHGKASILKGSGSGSMVSSGGSYKSSRQSNRVMFSTIVCVEDGMETLRLNCLTNGLVQMHRGKNSPESIAF